MSVLSEVRRSQLEAAPCTPKLPKYATLTLIVVHDDGDDDDDGEGMMVTMVLMTVMVDLINRWHTQSAMHAMTEAPLWTFIQIPRFLYRSRGRPVKQSQAYVLPSTVLLPVFADSVSLLVRWLQYRVSACIQHHGSVPSQGHYTAVAFLEQTRWMLDDEKEPLPLTDEQTDHLSANVYLMLLTCDAAALASSRDQQTLPHTEAHVHGCPSSASHSARGRPRLDLQSTLSDQNAALGLGGETRGNAASSESHAGTQSHHGGSSQTGLSQQVHWAQAAANPARADG